MRQNNSATPNANSAEPEECWTTVDGLRMRYLRAGSGWPLILLHGLLGYSFSWRFNIRAFARQRTVLAVDMPGAGFSERPVNRDCSFRAQARCLLQFVRNLGITSFDLLGTSHGGAVAMLAAAMTNESRSAPVRRLVLVDPVNPWSAHGRQLAPFLSGAMISGVLGWWLPHLRFASRAVVRRLYGDPRRISPGTVEGYVKPHAAPGSFDYFFQVLRTWNHDLADLEGSLATIADIPALLVWGSRDTAVDPNSAHELARHFHHCQHIEFSGVGHLPYEEVPQEFNAAVIQFLREPAEIVPSPSPPDY